MPRRNLHSRDQLHDMLLEAAETILVEEGGAALTARRVAFEIGYTVAGVYMAFDSMDELLAELNMRTARLLAAELNQCLAECNTNTPQSLTRLALAHWTFAKTHIHRWRLLFTRPAAPDVVDYVQALALIDQPFVNVFEQLQPGRGRELGLALNLALTGVLLSHYAGQPTTIDERRARTSIEIICRQFSLN